MPDIIIYENVQLPFNSLIKSNSYLLVNYDG